METAVVVESSLSETQVKSWSVASHMAFVLGYVIPLGGLLSLFLMLVILGGQSERVKKNIRAAFNVEITFLIVSSGAAILAIIGYTGFMALSAAGQSAESMVPIGLVTCFLLVAIYTIYRFVAAIQNAIKVSSGQEPYYSLAFRILR